MKLSGWIKRSRRSDAQSELVLHGGAITNTPLKIVDKQIIGAILVVLFFNMIYLSRGMLSGWKIRSDAPLYSEQKRGYDTVELTGSADLRGIYFIPPGTTLSGFLHMIGATEKGSFTGKELERVLYSGDVVTMDGNTSSRSAVQKGKLKNGKRLVLDLPINLNTANASDLMLVPGIGEKTAAAIIETRKDMGRFKAVDDLLEVRGIGVKKLEAFRKYFCIEDCGASRSKK